LADFLLQNIAVDWPDNQILLSLISRGGNTGSFINAVK